MISCHYLIEMYVASGFRGVHRYGYPLRAAAEEGWASGRCRAEFLVEAGRRWESAAVRAVLAEVWGAAAALGAALVRE